MPDLQGETLRTEGSSVKADQPIEEEDAAVAKQRKMLGLAYMLAMGVCGIVLVAIGSNLKQLAANCNTSATKVSVNSPVPFRLFFIFINFLINFNHVSFFQDGERFHF